MQDLEAKIYDYLSAHEVEILGDLEVLVKSESPTVDKEAVDACGAVLRDLYEKRLGVASRVFPAQERGDNLCTEWGTGDRKLLILGHFDTVHPIGSVPLKQEGNRLYGPGVIDMKGGLTAVIWGLRALQELGLDPKKKVVIVNNGDEEKGSNTSRSLIEQEAKGAVACLVAEPADPYTGKIKTSRKGCGHIDIVCRGKAAHSGICPEKGINANIELAHQIIALENQSDYEGGTTYSVNLISGGKVLNGVSDYAEAHVDWRICKQEAVPVTEAYLAKMKPVLPGAQVEMKATLNRPPLTETPESLALFALYQKCAANLDFKAEKGARSGGGSDGNFTSGMGIPTQDGLGVTGDSQHTVNEVLYLDQLVQRIAALAALILRI